MAFIAMLMLMAASLAGCVGRDDKTLSNDVKIQINVPDEPYPGTRTKVVTFDVQHDRDVFFDFYRSMRRVGMCSHSEIENENNAHEVMTISFWGDAVKHRAWFFILKDQKEEWIAIGYGNVEIYDHPYGFPKYNYSEVAVNRLKAWYEQNVPKEDRRRQTIEQSAPVNDRGIRG